MDATMNRMRFNRFFLAVIVFLLLFGLGGCLSFSVPQPSVLVVLRGSSETARWQATETLLPHIVDSPRSAGFCWCSWGGRPPDVVTLGPVADPEAFARRIRFGTVEEIEGRTVYVTVDENKTKAQVVVVKLARFFEELPGDLLLLSYIGRLKLISWWTGQSEFEVFLSDLGWRPKASTETGTGAEP
jgi:hypothetical protein